MMDAALPRTSSGVLDSVQLMMVVPRLRVKGSLFASAWVCGHALFHRALSVFICLISRLQAWSCRLRFYFYLALQLAMRLSRLVLNLSVIVRRWLFSRLQACQVLSDSPGSLLLYWFPFSSQRLSERVINLLEIRYHCYIISFVCRDACLFHDAGGMDCYSRGFGGCPAYRRTIAGCFPLAWLHWYPVHWLGAPLEG